MLILDWNHPEIALAEIFQREGSYKLDVDKSMFEKALLKKNREEAFTADFIQFYLLLFILSLFLLSLCMHLILYLNKILRKSFSIENIQAYERTYARTN